MEPDVEDELAFLSALPLEFGEAAIGVPSPRGFVTTPNVTASVTSPVSIGPFLKATLLLNATVAEVFLSHPSELVIPVLHQRKYPYAGTSSLDVKATMLVSAVPVLVLFTSLYPSRLMADEVGL